jgi:hypothetical protein
MTTQPTLDPSIIYNAKIGFEVLKETLHGIMQAKSEDSRINLAGQALWAADVIERDIKAAYENACAVHAAD